MQFAGAKLHHSKFDRNVECDVPEMLRHAPGMGGELRSCQPEPLSKSPPEQCRALKKIAAASTSEQREVFRAKIILAFGEGKSHETIATELSSSSPTWAGKFLDAWCRKVARSRLAQFNQVARSLQAHRSLLLNYFAASFPAESLIGPRCQGQTDSETKLRLSHRRCS